MPLLRSLSAAPDGYYVTAKYASRISASLEINEAVFSGFFDRAPVIRVTTSSDAAAAAARKRVVRKKGCCARVASQNFREP